MTTTDYPSAYRRLDGPPEWLIVDLMDAALEAARSARSQHDRLRDEYGFERVYVKDIAKGDVVLSGHSYLTVVDVEVTVDGFGDTLHTFRFEGEGEAPWFNLDSHVRVSRRWDVDTGGF